MSHGEKVEFFSRGIFFEPRDALTKKSENNKADIF
jgi:hypothetical protein